MRRDNPKFWTEDEDKFLIENYQTISKNDLCEILNIEMSQLTNRAFKLKLKKKSSWDNKNLINYFVELERKLGYIPSLTYFSGESTVDKPSIKDICNLGGYDNIIKKHNLLSEYLYNKQVISAYEINDAFNEIKYMVKTLGRLPYVKEYDSNRNKGLSHNNLEKQFGMSWNDIMIKHFGKPEYLKYTINESDIVATVKHLSTSKDTIIMKDVADYLGLSSSTIVDILNGKPFCDILSECGVEVNKASNIGKNKDDIVLEIKNFYNINNRLPIVDEVNSEFSFSFGTLINHCGSLENICKELNIEPIRKPLGWGNIVYDKNGELCRSIKEQTISNFLIDNTINFRKEVSYNELFGCNNNYRSDWLIEKDGDKFVVEYFGIDKEDYKIKMNKKIDILNSNLYIVTPIIITIDNFKKNKDLLELFKYIL